MNKKWLLLLIAFAVVLTLTACKKKDNVEDDELEGKVVVGDDKDEDKIDDDNEKELKYVFPLTGIKTAEIPDQRPVAVVINNQTQARPQAGISSADIVYELLVEADATRFLAIFQSELPERIGPVRSARDYFINIAKTYDAFFVAHGYSPGALQLLNSGVVDHINGIQHDGTYFKRSKDRKAPHNSYTSNKLLKQAAEKYHITLENEKKYDLSFYANEDSVKMGEVANNVQVSYYGANSSYSSVYQYDETSKKYYKSSPQAAFKDDLNEEKVAVSNLFIFETAHSVIDSEGRRAINLTDGGKAYVFQHGQMREVMWKNKNGFIVAVENDGSDVKLVPGKTWVQFVPTSPGIHSSVTYSENS